MILIAPRFNKLDPDTDAEEMDRECDAIHEEVVLDIDECCVLVCRLRLFSVGLVCFGCLGAKVQQLSLCKGQIKGLLKELQKRAA